RTQQRQFDHAVDTVVQLLEDGQKVLLHCKVGVNRSPSVAIAAIGTVQEMDYTEARDLVLQHRTAASPASRNRRLAEAYLDGGEVQDVGAHHSDAFLAITGTDARIRRFLWKLVN
ncbi:MAG: dual specificity protein phosphatase family protein, partial [Candidatus Nanohaloarchaea archaeon]|nr:dual specificity protein phosphatase family protein [Candidatus Nanohaloarchaea archaeon]